MPPFQNISIALGTAAVRLPVPEEGPGQGRDHGEELGSFHSYLMWKETKQVGHWIRMASERLPGRCAEEGPQRISGE